MSFFFMTLQTGTNLHDHGEPGEYVVEHTAIIRYLREKDGRVFRVGKVHAYRIQAGRAANTGASLFDVCDSRAMHQLYAILCDPERDALTEKIQSQFGSLDLDILVLDYCVLHPRWRGLKLGLVAIRKAVDLLGGGCGLVVCDIAPLNPDDHQLLRVPASWLPRHTTPEGWRQAVRKLRRHFKRMGFERIGKTPFYGLSLTRLTPSVEDMLKPGA